MPTASLSLSEFIASEIKRAFAAGAAAVAGAAAPAAVPKRRGRPPGKTKAAVSKAKAAVSKSKTPAKAKGGAADRDLGTVLAYVKTHPGERSEQIQKGIGGDGALIKEALAALTAKGRLRRAGYGRGGIYTAA